MTPEQCRDLERRGRAMLGDRLSTIEATCKFVRQELDAGNRLPLGSCYNHALALHHLLTREGMSARIIGGEAFWSLGPGEDDAIWFAPINGPGGFHVWLTIDAPGGPVSVDPSAYIIPRIAAHEGIVSSWLPSPALIWRAGDDPAPLPASAEPGVWRYRQTGLPFQISHAVEQVSNDQGRP